MSKELKPCPFCGETRLTIEDNQKVRDVHVLCKDCGAKTSFDGIRYDVAGRWNIRPVEHALQKRIEELEAERDRLKKDHAELGKKLGAMISFCGNLPEHSVTGEALEIVNEVYGC